MISWKASRGCEGQRDPWKPANQGPNAGRNRYSIREQSQQLLFWKSRLDQKELIFFSCVCLFGVFFCFYRGNRTIFHHHLGYIFGSFSSTEQANFRSFGKLCRRIPSANFQHPKAPTNFAEFCGMEFFLPETTTAFSPLFKKRDHFFI